MSVRKTIGLFCASAWLLMPTHLLAAYFESEYDLKPWVEMELQLPAFPSKESLIPFQISAKKDTRYYVDGDSLSVGSDDVIRYVLVIVSSTGAQNISFEGLRCATAERRLYAFGRSDRTWSKARNNQWVKVQGGETSHNVELYANYFCAIGAPVIMSPEDARRVLRAGGRATGIGP